MGFFPSMAKTPTKVVRMGDSPSCEMEASSLATTVKPAVSALRPMLTCSCKLVPIKRPGDREVGNIMSTRKMMLKTMLLEGGGG